MANATRSPGGAHAAPPSPLAAESGAQDPSSGQLRAAGGVAPSLGGPHTGPLWAREARAAGLLPGPLHTNGPECMSKDLWSLVVPLSALKTFAGNPNAGDIPRIAASLRFHGQYRAISYNANPDAASCGAILTGNHTFLAAKAENWAVIAATAVLVDDEEALRIVLTDNEVPKHATLDDRLVHGHITRLGSLDGTGFDERGLLLLEQRLTLLRPAAGEDERTMGAPRAADMPAPVDPTVGRSLLSAGDVVTIGGVHQLAIGDARDPATWGTLLRGAKTQVVVTSPPYARRRAYDATSGFRPPAPDDYVAWYAPLAAAVKGSLTEGGSYFLNIKAHCDEGQRSLYTTDLLLAHARAWGFRYVEEYVWVHTAIPGSVKRRLKNGYEPIYHFALSPSYYFNPLRLARPAKTFTKAQSAAMSAQREEGGLRRVTKTSSGMQGHAGAGAEITSAVMANSDGMAYPNNVLELGVNREAWGHGAAFPVALPLFFLSAFSDPGQAVCDPFAGSGTTLLAAEMLGRHARLIEISPHYGDLIVERYRRAYPATTLAINGESVAAAEWAAEFAGLGRDAGAEVSALDALAALEEGEDEGGGEGEDAEKGGPS